VQDGVTLLSFSGGFAYLFCIGVENRILLPIEVALDGGELTGDLVCGFELVIVFLAPFVFFCFLEWYYQQKLFFTSSTKYEMTMEFVSVTQELLLCI
jgi:hypothetical protein